jgi:hypothetical protein
LPLAQEGDSDQVNLTDSRFPAEIISRPINKELPHDIEASTVGSWDQCRTARFYEDLILLEE